MNLAHALVCAAMGVPGLAATWLVLAGWFDLPCSEESTARFSNRSFGVLVVMSLGLCGMSAANGGRPIHVELPWFALSRYKFSFSFVIDWISAPLSALCSVLCGTIGVYSRRYLHREPGFQRFYLLLLLFTIGVQLTVLAASLDVVLVGWELVGLCSGLLIAFFHERRKPVEHAIRAFFTYRLCDVGLLSAVVWIHHSLGTTEFSNAGTIDVYGLPPAARSADSATIGLLLLLAAVGKGGQAPFGGWLPRAMEGPTPSSAIFYGAISIHLAPFLLLRATPLLAQSTVATVAVIAIGAATAIHGTFVGRVQSDAKSVLVYASMTQVGVIFVEVGLGFHTLALVHLMGHACVRSLQILTSPNAIKDHQLREQTLGGPVPRTGLHLERLVPAHLQARLYRHALEGGYLDAFVRKFLLTPFVRTFRWFDAAERHFTSWVEGAPAAPAPSLSQPPEAHATLDGVR